MPTETLSTAALDEAVRPIVRDVRILHDFSYSIGASDFQVPNNRELPAEGATPPLVEALGMRLYAAYYASNANVGQAHRVNDRNLGRRFLNDLGRANRSTGTWIPGVRLVERDEARVKIQLRTKAVWVDSSLFESVDGDLGRLRGSRDTLHPSWYYFFGEQRPDVSNGKPLRLYWSLSVEGAIPFVRTLTETFNAAGIPFESKLLREPQAYTRCDAGVTYVSIADWDRVRAAVPAAHQAIAPYLRARTPMFAKRLAHGLAVAEDPGLAGTSFGMHRCGLVAQGLWNAYEAGADGEDGKAHHVRQAFADAGIDPATPHLGPGSRADYRIEPTYRGEWEA